MSLQDLPVAVAAVVEHAGRFLLVRRARDPFAGWWSPVTGRVEADETVAQAAVREVREEIGLVVRAGAPFQVIATADGSHALHFVRAGWIEGRPSPCPDEVRDWGWFTLAELRSLEPFFRQDLPAFEAVARNEVPS